MWLCKRDLSKECEGNYKDCTDCVLDKIKAEIEQIKEAEYQIYGKGSWRFVDKCLDIIDKYKAESEVEE